MRIKTNVEIVTGFLGAGKTLFINALIENTLVDGEKVLVIQCEKGEQKIREEFAKGDQFIIQEFDPQNPLTVEFLAHNLDLHRPHRVIIEHNGCRNLEELLSLLDEKELNKRCKVSAIYNITDAITYEMFVSNMGSLILDSIYNSNLIMLNNTKSIAKEKVEGIIKQLEKFNSEAFILTLSSITDMSSVLQEKKLLFNGYTKKISIAIKNLLSN